MTTRSVLRATTMLVAVALAPSLAAETRQDWRQAGLSSFDAAWRRIADTFYDPTFGGLDWSAVRQDIRPRVERAATADDQRAAIRDMLARLGHSHFALLTPADNDEGLRGEGAAPFDVRLSASGLLVTRVRDRLLPVQAGDVILRIDDVDTASLVTAAGAGDRGAADRTWRRITRALSGEPSSSLRLVVRSPGGTLRDVAVARVVPRGDDVIVGNLPPLRAHLEADERRTASGTRVGIIRFNMWMTSIAAPFATAVDEFREFDGLVIDLRGNPGGLAEMIRGVAGHLIDEPVLLGRMQMRDITLEFRANPRRSTSDGRSVRPFSGPVAVLVDELTASASECFAGGLQAIGRARVFGVSTAGQALPAVTERLPNGDVLLYAVGDFVTPAGRRLEGVGVVPDEEVAVTPEALASGQDAEAAALAWIDGVSR